MAKVYVFKRTDNPMKEASHKNSLRHPDESQDPGWQTLGFALKTNITRTVMRSLPWIPNQVWDDGVFYLAVGWRPQ